MLLGGQFDTKTSLLGGLDAETQPLKIPISQKSKMAALPENQI